MIYRVITDFRMVQGTYDPEQKEFVSQWIVPDEREYQRMTGAGDCFGDSRLRRTPGKREAKELNIEI